MEGKFCKFPNLWLRPQDKCPDCERITHPLCGVLTESKDKYRCSECAKNASKIASDGATTITQSEMEENNFNEPDKKEDKKEEVPDDVSCTEIVISNREKCGTIVSTITETKDRSNFTSIPKDYFIKSDQHLNMDSKDRDGDIWNTLKKAVVNEIDSDLKAMMIL